MKKSINQIYKKIIKQSKEKFYFEDFFVSNEVRAKIEIFQINLILVLWCLKKLKLPESNISFLISMFLKDLEVLLYELGEAESRIPRKIRKMTENFYGRLVSYSLEFDNVIEKKTEKIGLKLKANFKEEKIDYKKFSKYLRSNVKHLSKLNKHNLDQVSFFKYKKL